MITNKHAASLLHHHRRLYAAHLWDRSLGPLEPPVMVDVDPVDGLCNLDCAWCCQAASRASHERATYMPINTMRWLGPFCREWGVRSWRISGDSEPTLHHDLRELLYSGHEAGIEMGLITNGTMLDRLVPDLGVLRWLGVSLDAATRVTWSRVKGVSGDGFDRIVRYVRRVRERWPDLDVALKCVRWRRDSSLSKSDFSRDLAIVGQPEAVAVDNVEDAEALPRLAESLGVRAIVRDAYVSPDVQPYRFGRCRATPLGGVFGADHRFHLCCDARGRYVLTEDYRRDLDEVWGGDRHRELARSITPTQCMGCAKRDTNEIMELMVENDQLDFV